MVKPALCLLITLCWALPSAEISDAEWLEQLTSLDASKQRAALNGLQDQPQLLALHLQAVHQAAMSIDPDTIIAALGVLAQFRDDTLAATLVEYLDHPSETVQEAARDTLISITGRDRMDILGWQDWLSNHLPQGESRRQQFQQVAYDNDSVKLRAVLDEMGILGQQRSLICSVGATLIDHPDPLVSNGAIDLLRRQEGLATILLAMPVEQRHAWVAQYGLPSLLTTSLAGTTSTVLSDIEAQKPHSEDPGLSNSAMDTLFLLVWAAIAASFFYVMFRKGKQAVHKTLAIRRTRRITRRLVKESREKGHTARIRKTSTHRFG